MCTYCGVQWRRSQLRRDMSGGLFCPDEGEGRDELELSLANAEGAHPERYPVDGDLGGAMDKDATAVSPDQSLANTFTSDKWGRVTF